mmetsp:Transcript_12333/g.29300  ORF Transcript_12333/g.29300 Transcript_12333/m.29300 type:complete len:226 (+) Transcript_12333:46-723(+)
MDTGNEAAALVVRFCSKARIDLSGICVVTVHEDRGSISGSFVIDLRKKNFPVLLESYPSELPGRIQHKYFDGFSVSACSNLDPHVIDNVIDTKLTAESSQNVFCCDPSNWKRKSLKYNSKESVFADFLAARGTSEYKFKVRKQINYGKDVWTKFFELRDGKISDAAPATHKVHSFKNYVCSRCNMYYEIDLFSDHGAVNKHHMRPQAATYYSHEIITKMKNYLLL